MSFQHLCQQISQNEDFEVDEDVLISLVISVIAKQSIVISAKPLRYFERYLKWVSRFNTSSVDFVVDINYDRYLPIYLV
jgi:hypothetical protein